MSVQMGEQNISQLLLIELGECRWSRFKRATLMPDHIENFFVYGVVYPRFGFNAILRGNGEGWRLSNLNGYTLKGWYACFLLQGYV